MKILIAAAALSSFATIAFAQEAPTYTGDYSASVERNMDTNVDNGAFTFSQSASARDTGWGNYGPTVKPSDVYGGK